MLYIISNFLGDGKLSRRRWHAWQIMMQGLLLIPPTPTTSKYAHMFTSNVIEFQFGSKGQRKRKRKGHSSKGCFVAIGLVTVSGLKVEGWKMPCIFLGNIRPVLWILTILTVPQTKPHGHGDVHTVLYNSGLLPKWYIPPTKYILCVNY